MSLNKEAVIARLADSLPEGVLRSAVELKSRFLAASKSTRYTIVGASAGLLILLISAAGGSGDNGARSITFEARKGNLDITVLEGGALEALVSTEIRSGVKGREGAKNLSLANEGIESRRRT